MNVVCWEEERIFCVNGVMMTVVNGAQLLTREIDQDDERKQARALFILKPASLSNLLNHQVKGEAPYHSLYTPV